MTGAHSGPTLAEILEEDSAREAAFLKMIATRLGRTDVLRQSPSRDVATLAGLSDADGHPLTDIGGQQGGQSATDGDAMDAVETFISRLGTIGGHAARIGIGDVPDVIAELVQRYDVKSAIRWDSQELAVYGVDSACAAAGVTLAVWPQPLEIVERADIGITMADLAIAETGSLLLYSRAGQGRVVSLLPPVHVAFVPVARVVPRMTIALHSAVANGLRPTLNFVTGPSRTSDIEMDSTIGVHGPKVVHVYLIDQAGQ